MKHKHSRRRWLGASATALAIAGAIGTSTALAASVIYFDTNSPRVGCHMAVDQISCNLGEGGAHSGFHSLTSSEGRSYGGGSVCVAALDSNYNQVGSVSCSSTATSHPYNGSTRMAYGRASTTAGEIPARLRAAW